VPRHVLGGAGLPAPSDTLNVASVGIGGQGGQNTSSAQRTGANIVALCDVDDEFAANAFKSYPKAAKYKDFRKMLDTQKDIDAVIVATPDHSHAVIAMAAMRRGKHVYVQKPMTKYVWEARMLTEAARKYKVITQMGNQGHSGPGVRVISEALWAGVIGDVKLVESWTNRPIWPQGIGRPTAEEPPPATLDWDLWIGPAPMRPYAKFPDITNSRGRGAAPMQAYTPFNWRGWWDFGCGALGDMACHVLDPVFFGLKLKYPTSVEAFCSPVNTETFPLASIVRFEFPARQGMPPVKVSWYDGGLKPPRPEGLDEDPRLTRTQSGVLFIGTKGVLRCGEYGDQPTLFPKALLDEYTAKRPPETLERINASHEANWIQSCLAGKQATSNFDYTGPFTESVVMGCLALHPTNLGNRLLWNGEEMKFSNSDSGNRYVKPNYRQGWSLEM
jgi:predicted dehydrogenase